MKGKATDEQKMSILASLGRVKPAQLKMMNKENCHGLVREALKVMVSDDRGFEALEASAMSSFSSPLVLRRGCQVDQTDLTGDGRCGEFEVILP